MSDIFAPIVTKLVGLGFFNLLTFILAMALVYALLKQRKIFGDNVFINATIAFSIAFFIFAYPILTGISLITPITTFFSQAFLFILVFFIGFLVASIFYPEFPKVLGDFFKSRNVLFSIIALSVALFVTSGLVGIIYSSSWSFSPGPSNQPSAPRENILLIAGLIIAIVILLIAGSIRSLGE
jgi:hypothetical protein